MYYWKADYTAKPGREVELLLTTMGLAQPLAGALGCAVGVQQIAANTVTVIMRFEKLSEISGLSTKFAGHPDLVKQVAEGHAANTGSITDETVYKLWDVEGSAASAPFSAILTSIAHRGSFELRSLYASYVKVAVRLGARAAASLVCRSGDFGGVAFTSYYESADAYEATQDALAGDAEARALSERIAPLMVPGRSRIVLATELVRATP